MVSSPGTEEEGRRDSLCSLYKAQEAWSVEGNYTPNTQSSQDGEGRGFGAEEGKKGICGLLAESLRTVWTVAWGPRMRCFSRTWSEIPGA